MCVFVFVFNFSPLVILRTKEVQASIRRGQDMIISIQKTDGSWYGSWAICFTYACWFGIEALALDEISRKANKTLIDKCCGFLLSKQMSDGGWGESYQSCVRKEYRDSESGHVVCTAWALLSLVLANPKATASANVVQAVERGVRFLMNSQLPNGDWAQQSISGVFNRNCMISYSNYRYPYCSFARCLHHPHFQLIHEILQKYFSDMGSRSFCELAMIFLSGDTFCSIP